MKKNNSILLVLSLLTLSACAQNAPVEDEIKEEEPVKFTGLANLQKGFEVTGQIVATKRYYSDDSYEFIDDSREVETKNYAFDFTYTDKEDFVGLHRNLYSYDNHNQPHMILDENLYNKDGKVRIKYIGYENEMFEDYVYDSTGNALSYGANDLINPFLFMENEDFSHLSDNTFTLSNKKLSQMVAGMFSSIDVTAFSGAISRNILEIDENGDIKTLICTLDESYKEISTSNYGTDYTGTVYSINFNFKDIGTADSASKLQVYEGEEECAKLRTIFDKMEGQNLRIRRVDHSWYNDDEEIDVNETIDLYYADHKVFYQVYTLDEYEEITAPRESDFLLMNPDGDPNGNLYPYARSYNGVWNRTGMGRLDITTYENYFPIIGDVSHKIFHYDKERDIYYLDEPMALYWLLDGCFLPTMAVSDPGYFDFLSKVEVKLDENGDIEYARCEYYHELDLLISHAYYELTYEYGPSVHLPYNIEEEVK